MIHWRRLIPWLLRAWPVLALAPVGVIHAIALRAFPSDPVAVNKLVGMGLQVIGGLLVLYSVNDNLGLFRSQSLTSTIIGWFKAFPYVRKPISLSASASSSGSATATMSATVTRALNTLEERVAEVERRLVEVQRQLTQEVQAINAKIEDAKSELGKQIAETSTRVSDLSKRLEHAAVGGFKFQALGVLLALYGAVTSVFA